MPPQSQPMPSRRVSFEVAAMFALLATVILAGITFIPVATIPVVSTKTFILAIGTIITLALFILARLSRGNVILPPFLLIGALWLPTVAYGLSTVFSGASISRSFFGFGLSIDTLGFMLVMSVLGTLTALAFRRHEHYQLFFKAAFGFAIFVALVQLAFVVVGQFAPNIISPSTSLFGSVVDLASFAGLIVIGSLLALRLLPIEGRARIGLFGVSAIALFILALLNAQLEWVIIALVSLGLFVEAVMRRAPSGGEADLEGSAIIVETDAGEESVGERSLLAPLAALAIALFFLIGSNISTILANTLNVSVLDVRPSWQSTLNVGQQVYANNPVFGSGPTTFGEEWLKYRDGSLNQTIFWNIDFNAGIGFIPTSFVTTGLLGAAAWILLFLALLYMGVRSIILSSSNDPFIRFVTMVSFAAVVYLSIIAVATNAGAMTLALLFVFAGMFASSLRFAPGKTQWGIIFARSPRIGFVIVFALTIVLLGSIVGAYTVVERYLAQVDVLRANTALAAGDLGTARTSADNAVSLVPLSEAYQLQARVAQAQMNVIANDTSLTPAVAQQNFQQELANGINAALNATRVAPNDYRGWMTLGDLYATVVPLNVEGSFDNALAAYQRALELNPTSPVIPFNIAQLQIAVGNNADARASLTRAITAKQDYTPAIFLLSQLEVATGNVNDALAAAEAAAFFTPNDPGILFQVGVLRAATGNAAGAIQALEGAVAIDTQFANARYFLAALYARAGDLGRAQSELEAIASVNQENAQAVAPLIAALVAGDNPFPANLLSVEPPPEL